MVLDFQEKLRISSQGEFEIGHLSRHENWKGYELQLSRKDWHRKDWHIFRNFSKFVKIKGCIRKIWDASFWFNQSMYGYFIMTHYSIYGVFSARLEH